MEKIDAVTLNQAIPFLYKDNIKLLKYIEKMDVTPYQLHKKLGISKKVKTMTQRELNYDGDYLLWMAYSQYWKGIYGK